MAVKDILRVRIKLQLFWREVQDIRDGGMGERQVYKCACRKSFQQIFKLGV